MQLNIKKYNTVNHKVIENEHISIIRKKLKTGDERIA